MNGGDFSLFDLFREEVRAHAATLTQGLLELEREPANPQRVEPLMRAAHSIKGAARIVNLDAAVQLAHVLEDAFVAAQEGRARISPDDIDTFLRGADVLAGLADVREDAAAGWSSRHEAEIADLKQAVRAITQGQPAGKREATRPPSSPSAPQPAPRAISIPTEPVVRGDDYSMLDLFREEVRANALTLDQGLREIGTAPADPQRLEALMRAAHSIKGAARIVNLELAVQLAHAMEEALVAVQEGRLRLEPAETELLLRGTDVLAGLIHADDAAVTAWTAAQEAEVARLKGLLQSICQGGRESKVVPKSEPASGTQYSVLSIQHPTPAPAAPPEEAPAPAAPAVAAEVVVRVTAQSLNRLMGLAGESLVQARWLQPFSTALLKLKKHQDHLAGLLDNLAQTLSAGDRTDQLDGLVAEARRQAGQCRQVLAERMGEFEDHAAQAEDLNTRLYREVIVSRMRPFADGAHGFPRLVRDMARQLDKQVRLEVDGEATEVDRDILEKLEAPLTHLLRNAIDHGIEPPAEREAAGKPACGLVRLDVRHRAGMLAVTVGDDGGGIDLDRLRHKVVERGLTAADLAQAMTEAELLEFLFLPGFSTAAALTEYSGRGVGLDVVQTTIRKVGGTVRVSTRRGRGTAFHLQLPITLSVLRAVLVEVGGEPFAFPHNRIDRLLHVPRDAVRSLEHRQFITVDGQNVGLVLAAQVLDLPSAPLAPVRGGEGSRDEVAVDLLRDVTGQNGLIVEAFRGEQDLVVRPLDPRLGKVPNVSAAAILDDGAPVLIADVEDLIRSMDQFIQGGTLRRSERDGAAAGPRKRVLVVDDSITVREVERQLLRHQGYDVAVAVDGQEGWNLVRAERFDLVVSDVDMPRMNGLELVRAMRAEPALRDLPVIIVSYKEREEDRLRGLEVGANYYLTKSSFHDNTFLQAVADLIGEA
jgi:two-component system sensor histidine kinase and response regulator WspE